MTDRKRILIVDDDPDIGALFEAWLGPRHDLVSVHNYADGLEQIQTGRFDLHIIDYRLDAGRDGLALIDEAAAREFPIILITAYHNDPLGDRAMVSGVADFVYKKHLSAGLLDRVMRNVLARHQRQRKLLERQAELSRLAQTDVLTGLMNRAALSEQIDLQLERHPDDIAALLYLDLDGFKAVNDQHGHEAGDELLRIVARRLVGAVRSTDLVGRIAGDEFLVFLVAESGHELSPKIVKSVADKLVAVIGKPYLLRASDQTLAVTVSIGAATSPEHGASYQVLSRNADQAMYRAKQGGKNRSESYVSSTD